ncbi:hypothetical protein [Pyrolobus fumarii]|uniref:hypothetical protein n=1 Tax=Pyrolobus fumarii TaxID=54252 RepID=UPI00064E741B|nr:hypothetical protein [Pyrolobus fumarii]
MGLLLGWVFREVKGLYDRVLRFAERLEAVRGELEAKLYRENGVYHAALLGEKMGVTRSLVVIYEDVGALYPREVDEELQRFYAYAVRLREIAEDYPSPREIREMAWRFIWRALWLLTPAMALPLAFTPLPAPLDALASFALIPALIMLYAYNVLDVLRLKLEESDEKRREFCAALGERIGMMENLSSLRGKRVLSRELMGRLCG